MSFVKSPLLLVTTTKKPSLANFFAIEAPRKSPAPTTNAIFFLNMILKVTSKTNLSYIFYILL